MKAIQSALIVGLGAIGSIYATKLQQYDPQCVRVLVDETRLARYTSQGIVMNGVRQDFRYVLADQTADQADLIVIATKADALDEAIRAIDGFVHDGTVILALLNGISSEETIAARYGWDKVLHSYFIGHGSTRSGNAVTFDGVGRIVFGEAGATGRTARVARVCAFFDRAGIDYDVPEDILFSMWCKFVVNVGINQASAVLRASYGDFQRSAKAYAYVEGLMQEAVLIAGAAGISQSEKLLPWSEHFIRNMPAGFKSSMLQDIEAGKKTEVDLFGGTICRMGAQYGIATPQNALFLSLIRALEEMQGGA